MPDRMKIRKGDGEPERTQCSIADPNRHSNSPHANTMNAKTFDTTILTSNRHDESESFFWAKFLPREMKGQKGNRW